MMRRSEFINGLQLMALLHRWHFSHLFCAGIASLVLSASLSVAAQGVDNELLDAEHAFELSARRVSDRQLELSYSIASGYYLYRDRFKFQINGKAIDIKKVRFPRGERKNDPNFGNVVTYRAAVNFSLPVGVPPNTGKSDEKTIKLSVTSQGCADVGICYPPLRQEIVFSPGSSDWVRPDSLSQASPPKTPASNGSTLADILTGPKR